MAKKLVHPQTIQLGKTVLQLSNHEFDEGLETGISAFFDAAYDGEYDQPITTHNFLHHLLETLHMTDVDCQTGMMVPEEWKIGYIMGKVVGMLVYQDDEEEVAQVAASPRGAKPCLEAITRKYQQLYPPIPVAQEVVA